MWRANRKSGITVALNGHFTGVYGSNIKQGDLYATNYNTGEVLKYTSSGSTSNGTIVGIYLDTHFGLYLDQCDNIYASDYGNSEIQQYIW
jgi:hypothetical protein